GTTMARQRSAPPKKQLTEPARDSQEGPGPTSTSKAFHRKRADGIKKADAVRAALAEGVESPSEAVDFIRKRFGIEIAKQHFSAQKSQLKKRDEARKVRRPEHGTKSKAVRGYLAPPPKIVPTGEGDLLDVMESMKPLIAQYGADRV